MTTRFSMRSPTAPSTRACQILLRAALAVSTFRS